MYMPSVYYSTNLINYVKVVNFVDSCRQIEIKFCIELSSWESSSKFQSSSKSIKWFPRCAVKICPFPFGGWLLYPLVLASPPIPRKPIDVLWQVEVIDNS